MPASGVAANKAKTRRALLGGLRSGKLEAAVAKMEAESTATVYPAYDSFPFVSQSAATPDTAGTGGVAAPAVDTAELRQQTVEEVSR